MPISQADMKRQMAAARSKGWDSICARAEQSKGLQPGLLLAIASRETDMSDVVGDAGHGRGLFQIDDRSWPEWLGAHGAARAGTKPPVNDAARLAAAIVSDNLAFGRRNGVADPDLLKFALSAYNAGPGGAIKGYREGDSDLHTTGNDYGADVLGRLELVDGGGQPAPAQPVSTNGASRGDGILRVGASGSQVLALKDKLAQWFGLNAPGEWDGFAIESGAFFGPKLERAVRVFQERLGLLVDGEVGPQTLGALGIVPVPRPAAPRPALLTLDRTFKAGMGGPTARLIQGWLTLNGFAVALDGELGPASQQAISAFQRAKRLPVTGTVDQATYDRLTAPMQAALAPISPRGKSIGKLVVSYAKQQLAQSPRELGDNQGPWVSLYTKGDVGNPWCAGFATFCLEQACTTLGVPLPIPYTLGCDFMADCARQADLFLDSPRGAARRKITPGSFFLRRDTTGRLEYAHTGIVVDAESDFFHSIEGNTNDDGSAEGYEVCARTRGYPGMDFVLIQ
jgi:peptidoglycan hydrolase-like protein with peptidoglycan-binding domain